MSQTTSATTGRRYGLERVCRLWEQSRSAFYARRDRLQRSASADSPCRRGPTPALSDAQLLAAIRNDLARSPPPSVPEPAGRGDRPGAVSELVLEAVTPAAIDVAVEPCSRSLAVHGSLPTSTRWGIRPSFGLLKEPETNGRYGRAISPTGAEFVARGCERTPSWRKKAAVSARASRESARGRQPGTALERGAPAAGRSRRSVRRRGQDPAAAGHSRDEGAGGGAGRRPAARLA